MSAQVSRTEVAETEPIEVNTVETTPAAPSLSQRFFNVRTLLSFGLGFAILAFLFTRVQIDVGAIVDRVRQANVWLLAAALVVFYLTFPIRAVRWRRLLDNVEVSTHEEGGRRLGTAGLSEIMFLAWFANCIVPAKLGDVYRAYLLKLNVGVSFSTTIGTVLAERIVDVVILFALMLAATWLSFGQAVPGDVLTVMQLGMVLVVAVVIGLISMRRLRPLIERVLPARFHAQYAKFEHGTLNSFRGIPVLVVLTVVAWAAEVGRLWLVTLSLGLGGISQSVIVFVALAAALMTTLPLTPAGLGFAEGAIVGVFLLAAKAGLAPGVDEHAAASIALLDRGISYWSLIALGLIVYPLSRKK
ncbi:MAG: flippase-like domain-containing protein [Chloroflexi bacterium]|nr:flippase-like domain-containing protein [Chloroflexota bacterium]MBV9596163.1 flippase-like domain-containing protein [Chloroflexota bacterium]